LYLSWRWDCVVILENSSTLSLFLVRHSALLSEQILEKSELRNTLPRLLHCSSCWSWQQTCSRQSCLGQQNHLLFLSSIWELNLWKDKHKDDVIDTLQFMHDNTLSHRCTVIFKFFWGAHGVVRKSGRGSFIYVFYCNFMLQFFIVFCASNKGFPEMAKL